MIKILLKRGEEKNIQKGYPWVFADQVASESILVTEAPGSLVELGDYRGKYLASGYLDADSKICLRLFNRKVERLDIEFFKKAIESCLHKRSKIYNESFYRLVNAEGDDLPGLIIDRFGDYLSCQFNNAGILAHRKTILKALAEVFSPKGIVARVNKTLEIIGNVPDTIQVVENGLKFSADLISGQKTGWYYDQRENRSRIAELAQGRSILDVFCYSGGFGVYAAAAGASALTLIDSSSQAMELVAKNLKLNGIKAPASLIAEDVFAALDQLTQTGEKFDIIVLDPPPFIKNRQNKAAGIKGYEKLLKHTLPLLAPHAHILYATCSHHMQMHDLCKVIATTFKNTSHTIIGKYGHAKDHPTHPHLPESRYLNAVLVEV